MWIYARKVPYAHLIGDNVYMDPLMFVFSSAILCLPASILYWAMHDNKKNYILLPIVNKYNENYYFKLRKELFIANNIFDNVVEFAYNWRSFNFFK